MFIWFMVFLVVDLLLYSWDFMVLILFWFVMLVFFLILIWIMIEGWYKVCCVFWLCGILIGGFIFGFVFYLFLIF